MKGGYFPLRPLIMKLVKFFSTIAALIVTSTAVQAQIPSDLTQDNNQAQELLQKMLLAEKDLRISGDQVTVLYRPEQTFTSTQSVERVGNHDLRLEYHSPDAVAGELYVDNGKVAWNYMPSAHKLQVGISGLERFEKRSDGILRRLNNHDLTAEIIGQDTIAGQNVDVIKVTDHHSWGEHRYWIDPVTGAQLKIQTSGSLGQTVSETYYTKVTYGANFGRDEFGAPRVDSDVATVPMFPHGSQLINCLPTAPQCGFAPMAPAYIPAGFTFQSAVVMPINGQKMVGLTYENDLVTLSIFEQPVLEQDPHDHDDFKSPRQGVLTARFHGYQYIVIGSMPSDVMQRVVQSMH